MCNSGGTLTGITNDLGFENIYAEQLKYQASSGDIFIGISGSGTSKNIVEGISLSKDLGLTSVLITRNESPSCADKLDLLIPVTGDSNIPGQTGKNNNNIHFNNTVK